MEWTYQQLPTSPLPTEAGVEKSPFQTAPKRLEMDENVNSARLIRHFLSLKWCREQSYSFRQSLKYVNANRTQYVQSSSNLIIIVVMILFINVKKYWQDVELDSWHQEWPCRAEF